MKRLLTFIALTWATCGGIYLSAQDTAKPVSSPAGAVHRGDGGTPVVPGTAPRAKALPDVPSGVTARPGQLVRVVVKSEAEVGFLRSFTDDDAFFDELAPKPGQRRFVFQSDRPGVYVVGFWNRGELEGVSCKITVTGTVPPKPDDPVDPPVTPTGKYYFMIVRPDGPASPAFTQAMSLPAWEELSKAGHLYKDKTVTEAAALGYTLPPGTTLPMVVTLEIVGNVSKVVRGPVPFPTTPGGIADLPKGIK